MEETVKVKKVNVTVVKTINSTCLVEAIQAGRRVRVFLPAREVAVGGGKVDQQIFNAGAPYSMPWKEVILDSGLSMSAEQAGKFEAQLYDADVWTFHDIINSPNAVVGALRAVYQLDLVALILATRKYIKKEERTNE
jgi:hypothetical protein